jgi:hypothetical protein
MLTGWLYNLAGCLAMLAELDGYDIYAGWLCCLCSVAKIYMLAVYDHWLSSLRWLSRLAMLDGYAG